MKNKIFIVGLILLFLLSLSGLWNKIQTERSMNTVEFSVDYLSLLHISEQNEQPQRMLDCMLRTLKSEGITTLTLPNNTFASLESRGLVSVLSSDELGAMQLLSKNKISVERHLTYLLFLEKESERELLEMLSTRFSKQDIEVVDLNGQVAVGIDLPMTKLLDVSIPYLESDIQFLTQKPYEFSLVLKIDNKWQGQEAVALTQLMSIPTANISSIYFADAGVIGFPDSHTKFIPNLPRVPFAYKEYFTPEEKQKGIESLAKARNYEMIRMHSLPHTLFIEQIAKPQVLVERMKKAVKERNIRLFHVEFPWEFEGKTGEELFASSLGILKESKEQLEQDGFRLGKSEPFTQKEDPWLTVGQWSAVLAGIFVVVWAVHAFLPKWVVLSGIVLTLFAGSMAKVGMLPWQFLALLIAISIPLVLAQWVVKQQNKKTTSSLRQSIGQFISVSLFSIAGGCLLASMHASLPHLLYFQPFRGVSLAHVAPPVLVGFFLLKTFGYTKKDVLWKVALAPIRVYQVLFLAIVAIGGMYYLSRTGNSGVMLPFEAEFRSLLENTFGVRPRTKEFLFAHPLLVLVLFYWQKHQWVKWGLPVAIIGQLSIVNTFTHFHTPVLVSLQRELVGIGLGLGIGLLLIAGIEGMRRLMKKKNVSKET